MTVGSAPMPFTIDTERPINPRDYERSWDFDRTIVRFCIQGYPTGGAGQFAPLLQGIEEEYGPVLLEADELWSPLSTVEALVQKVVFDFHSVAKTDPRDVGAKLLEANGLIKFGTTGCAFLAGPDQIEPVLTHMEVREWWGSLWGAKRPYSFLSLAESGCHARMEPLLLESIADCSPIFFLAPNHGHLELMARNCQAERLCETVARNCSS